MITQFVEEQLKSTSAKSARQIESHKSEALRLGLSRERVQNRRSLLASASVVLQRACANEFLERTCDRIEGLGGTSQTYFERHRGDETPFTRVSATDSISDKEALALEDDAIGVTVPPHVHAIAVAPIEESSNIVEAQSVTANLKVYQADLEIAGLYILADCELLVSFKIVQPLSRLDRCTGRNYAALHRRQSFLLPVADRFQRKQRLHTSDGDLAQDLG